MLQSNRRYPTLLNTKCTKVTRDATLSTNMQSMGLSPASGSPADSVLPFAVLDSVSFARGTSNFTAGVSRHGDGGSSEADHPHGSCAVVLS